MSCSNVFCLAKRLLLIKVYGLFVAKECAKSVRNTLIFLCLTLFNPTEEFGFYIFCTFVAV